MRDYGVRDKTKTRTPLGLLSGTFVAVRQEGRQWWQLLLGPSGRESVASRSEVGVNGHVDHVRLVVVLRAGHRQVGIERLLLLLGVQSVVGR